MKLDKIPPDRSLDGTATQRASTQRRPLYLKANLFAACFGLAVTVGCTDGRWWSRAR